MDRAKRTLPQRMDQETRKRVKRQRIKEFLEGINQKLDSLREDDLDILLNGVSSTYWEMYD